MHNKQLPSGLSNTEQSIFISFAPEYTIALCFSFVDNTGAKAEIINEIVINEIRSSIRENARAFVCIVLLI